VHLRAELTLDQRPVAAALWITADNGYEVFLNGTRVGGESGAAEAIWRGVERYDLSGRLAPGLNAIGIRGSDLGGVRGVLAALRVQVPGQAPLDRVTGPGWLASLEGDPAEYSHPEYAPDSTWRPATVLGPQGMAPWGVLDPAWTPPRTPAPPPATVALAPGLDFRPPPDLAYVDGDRSVYVPERGDAWGLVFRVGDWSRAYTEFDLPAPAKTGRRLMLLPAGSPEPRVLLDAGAGVLGSPSATYDGRAILIAYAPAGESFYHIHRVPLDGGPPVRLTEGPFHDLDPVELPDGRICFASTRIGTFEEYHQPPSRALFRMNPDGSGIHPVTATLIFDAEPKVAADGRVVFIRSDNFFDRGKVETHLHSIRPDGTDGQLEAGANSGPLYGNRLRTHGYGSPAPLPQGGLAYLSNRGHRLVAPGAPEHAGHPLPPGLGDLAPLPDGRLLCTVLRPAGRARVSDQLAVYDPADGRLVRVHETPGVSLHSPVAVAARPRPPVLPDYADTARGLHPEATGFLFCQDARFTTKTRAGWERVRAVRVLGARPLTVRSSHSHIVHVGHEGVELGLVPLGEDGSFHVEVPADLPLALQAVDAEGHTELNEMSWLYVRPGERRSCSGCHQPRESAPPPQTARALALGGAPLQLLDRGDPLRFRGNNAAVNGLLDRQLDRFRECASLNAGEARESAADLLAFLRGPDPDLRVSAVRRLAHEQTRSAAPDLAAALRDPAREVRVAAGFALAVVGGRAEIPALVEALADPAPPVVRAAHLALENLTGHAHPAEVSGWRAWLGALDWPRHEDILLGQIRGGDAVEARAATIALGHVGSSRAIDALRERVRALARVNPYPEFVRNNRTDRFTFSADTPANPRPLQEAVRALGRCGSAAEVPFLAGLLASNTTARTGNLFLYEAAAEALGGIGGTAAESALMEAFARLGPYWDYVGWYGDHPALYACHSSPPHARVLTSLDRLRSAAAAPILAALLASVPTDPDRGLFPANDDYENTVGRLLRRAGQEVRVVETCLALLGDPAAVADPALRAVMASTHPAWAGHPGAENRAAQILSLAARDPVAAPRVRQAFARLLARPEEPVKRELGNPKWTPVRHWVLFYLARALGHLRDPEAVPLLAATLGPDRAEDRHGRPDPGGPEVHFLHWEYTPCWRAAAAWALGEIGDRSAWPTLLAAVQEMRNAVDVRHTAATALVRLASPADQAGLRALAATYPEFSVRRALLEVDRRPPAESAALSTP
jgi:HEAT repeat protein